jgi:hydrogenase expression/formation protein HypD
VKFVDEFRDPDLGRAVAGEILSLVEPGRHYKLMEVCGGHTHSIYKYGVDDLLPANVELVHGPGCPVCVIPMGRVDDGIAVAHAEGVIFTCFGDMMRVPGSNGTLLEAKAAGADVRMVYSPLDALRIAKEHPDRQVVFFAIGFETTAPPNAMAVWLARKRRLTNFSVLVSHVLVPPMITAILQAPGNRVRAFLGPGHVCTVMGLSEYEPIARRYGVPIVVTGFEPIDLLEGVLRTVEQLEAGQAEVENQYARAVRSEGNRASRRLIEDVFEICDRKWRGVGLIPKSGFKLRYEYRAHDAERIFEVADIETQESSLCISGQVLKGLKKPHDCPAFGKECTPQTPLGATMVSAEGACAAYHAYGRHLEAARQGNRIALACAPA